MHSSSIFKRPLVSLLLCLIFVQGALSLPSQTRNLHQVDQYTPEQLQAMRAAIKAMSAKDKESKQIYAVKSGCPVRCSSAYNFYYIQCELDYNLHTPHGWCPRAYRKGEWIQVSKEEPAMWTDIILQGRGDVNDWVTSFKVAYSLDGHQWQLAENSRIFEGSYDRQSKRRITFNSPIFARALRIYPQTWHIGLCLRFDAIYINFQFQQSSQPTNISYGYAVAEKQCSVSYECVNSTMQNNQIDSTQKDASAWVAKYSKAGVWIQVGCNNIRKWIGVIMQGRGNTEHWVNTIKIATSEDGNIWEYVQNGKIFQANGDRNTKVRIKLNKPIQAKIVRIYPQTWHNWISLRFDALYLKQK